MRSRVACCSPRAPAPADGIITCMSQPSTRRTRFTSVTWASRVFSSSNAFGAATPQYPTHPPLLVGHRHRDRLLHGRGRRDGELALRVPPVQPAHPRDRLVRAARLDGNELGAPQDETGSSS